ncbi:divalent metal cation transporter, partial [Limosilactobacillus fermentum]|nr:divalent metal cation transporter [Limosilactobacillus fermentum]
IMGAGYHHPAWLTWTGWLVVIFMAYAGINTVLNLL